MNSFFEVPAGKTRLSVVFMALLLLHVSMKFWLGGHIIDLKLTGDENAYSDAAMALSNLVRDLLSLSPPDASQIGRSVVGNGWFMPGMAVLLTPLYLVVSDPSILAVRIYMGLLSLGALLWALRSAYKNLGPAYALALLAFPSVAPIWVLFSFTAWGDLYAGLLLVVLLCHSLAILRNFREQQQIRLWDGAKLGVLAISCLYLRSSVLPLIPLLFAFLGAGLMMLAKGSSRIQGVKALAMGAIAFVALLLPWSITASAFLKSRVVTTTTVPISMAVAFGNPNQLCFGSCGKGNIWFNSVRYSKQIAAMRGEDEITVQKSMSRYAMRHVTARSYSAKVLTNIRRYAFFPSAFVKHFLSSEKSKAYAAEKPLYEKFIDAGTRYPYYLFLLMMAISWFVVKRRSVEKQLESLLLKLFTVAMLAQPFVHISGGRYWTVFAPLCALSAAFVMTTALQRVHKTPGPPAMILEASEEKALFYLQVAFAIALTFGAAILLWLGNS